MITVRPARMADAEAMSRVLIASITELCTADHGNDAAIIAAWTRNKTADSVGRMIANPEGTMLVAERGGKIAAVGCILAPDEIGLNYVAPAHRLQGVSRALLGAMEALLQQRGVTLARLTSTATAHQFYLGAAWEDAGPEDRTRPGMVAYPMHKRL